VTALKIHRQSVNPSLEHDITASEEDWGRSKFCCAIEILRDPDSFSGFHLDKARAGSAAGPVPGASRTGKYFQFNHLQLLRLKTRQNPAQFGGSIIVNKKRAHAGVLRGNFYMIQRTPVREANTTRL
jgi:hypothetical protein